MTTTYKFPPLEEDDTVEEGLFDEEAIEESLSDVEEGLFEGEVREEGL